MALIGSFPGYDIHTDGIKGTQEGMRGCHINKQEEQKRQLLVIILSIERFLLVTPLHFVRRRTVSRSERSERTNGHHPTE